MEYTLKNLETLARLEVGDKLSMGSSPFGIRKRGIFGSFARTWYREDHSCDYQRLKVFLDEIDWNEIPEDLSARVLTGLSNYAETYRCNAQHFELLQGVVDHISREIDCKRHRHAPLYKLPESPRTNFPLESSPKPYEPPSESDVHVRVRDDHPSVDDHPVIDHSSDYDHDQSPPRRRSSKRCPGLIGKIRGLRNSISNHTLLESLTGNQHIRRISCCFPNDL